MLCFYHMETQQYQERGRVERGMRRERREGEGEGRKGVSPPGELLTSSGHTLIGRNDCLASYVAVCPPVGPF